MQTNIHLCNSKESVADGYAKFDSPPPYGVVKLRENGVLDGNNITIFATAQQLREIAMVCATVAGEMEANAEGH